MSIRSLNIAPRAGLGFGLLGLMVFALGAFALLQMSNMRAQSDEVDNNWLPSVMAVGEMSQDILRLRPDHAAAAQSRSASDFAECRQA